MGDIKPLRVNETEGIGILFTDSIVTYQETFKHLCARQGSWL